MRLLIITNVTHSIKNEKIYSYSPYVREMNIWSKTVDEVIIVAPFFTKTNSAIDIAYESGKIRRSAIPTINFQTLFEIISSLIKLPSISIIIFKEMKSADHIHLRCPGNIGLLGCIIQLFFPYKQKSAKYAGNWDPKSNQPLSYKLQKWILSNTFLTKNMTVLVYGEWPNQTKNIKSFFTATYFEKDKTNLPVKNLEGRIKFLFVGTLSLGKRPLYALKLIEMLYKDGVDVQIDFYGEGAEMKVLENYITNNQLNAISTLHYNQAESVIRTAYKESHFLILPSKSEGWPKVVAEAMFWGVVPIASTVSCVPNMLNFGERGILLQMDLKVDFIQISNLLNNPKEFETISSKAKKWSRYYTLDLFEDEIKSIIRIG